MNKSFYVAFLLVAAFAFSQPAWAASEPCRSETKAVETRYKSLGKGSDKLARILDKATRKAETASEKYNDKLQHVNDREQTKIASCDAKYPNRIVNSGFECALNILFGSLDDCNKAIAAGVNYTTCLDAAEDRASTARASAARSYASKYAGIDRSCVSSYNQAITKYNRDAGRYDAAVTAANQCTAASTVAEPTPQLTSITTCFAS